MDSENKSMTLEEREQAVWDRDLERLREILVAEVEDKRRMLERLDAIEQRLERLERRLLE